MCSITTLNAENTIQWSREKVPLILLHTSTESFNGNYTDSGTEVTDR